MSALKLFVLPTLLLGAGLYSFIPTSEPDSGSRVTRSMTQGCGTDFSPDSPAKKVFTEIPKTKVAHINDLHIKYEPAKAGIANAGGVTLTDGGLPGKPLGGWKFTDDGNGQIDAKFTAGNGNKPISPTQGAVLTLTAAKDLTSIKYTLTRNGAVKGAALSLVSPDPVSVTTCNQFPATTGALFEFENQTGEPLSELYLAPQSQQQIIELGSDAPGFPVLEEGRFVFDPPIEPGEWSTIYWHYDEFGPDPEVLTVVILTPIFLAYVFEPMAATTGPKQKQGRVKILRANGQNQRLPPFKIKEYKVGGLPKTLVIKCDANMSFVAGTGLAQVLVGDHKVSARPRVQADGKELVLTIGRSKARLKGEIRLSGLQVKLAKGAFGSARLYVPTGKSWRSITVGMVR